MIDTKKLQLLKGFYRCKRMYKKILFILLLLPSVFYGQKNDLPASIKMDFKMPVTLSNEAFSDAFTGMISSNIFFEKPIVANVNLGFGMNYSYYQIDKFNVPDTTTGGMQAYTPFIRVAYEKFVTERGILGFGLNMGYSTMVFNSESCLVRHGDGTTTENAFYLEPQLSYNIFSQNNLAFGFTISYSFYNSTFDSDVICVDHSNWSSESAFEGKYGVLNFGVGFAIFLDREREYTQ